MMIRRVLALALLAAVCACAWLWWPQIRNEFFVVLGSRNEPGGWYGFNSGAGGAFYMSLIPAAMVFYWQHTCHASPRCLRWGKFPAAGGLFKLCWRHHPDNTGGDRRPSRTLIGELHAVHALPRGFLRKPAGK